jgi:hypothetical protein
VPWTDSSPTSRIFQQALLNPIMGRAWTTAAPTTFGSFSADAMTVALFNNTTSPDANAAVGSTGYNTGTWVTGNEVIDATNWVAGGRVLASKTFVSAGSGQTVAGSVTFDAADLSGGGNVTITNAYGDLLYDATVTAGTVAKQGMAFHYFGGAQSVTAGTFTIVWNANGLIQVTM